MSETKELIAQLTAIAAVGELDESALSMDIFTIENAAQRLKELDKPDGVWKYDEDQSMYDTGCGEAWMFSDPVALEDHSVKFCPFCGGAVKENVPAASKEGA